MGQVLWTNNFIKHQGYESNGTIVYLDNNSAILLEKKEEEVVAKEQNI